ncbi:hypothetical protein BD309DRAFT_729333 [Dichomitus squalens]|nr:hypothetical protein BD309DRAFT_729333 [Dichomitus squalens]
MATLTSLFRSVRFQVPKAVKICAAFSQGKHFAAGDATSLLAAFFTVVSASSLQSLELSFRLPHFGYPPAMLGDWSGPILPFCDMRTFSLSSSETLYRSVDGEDIGSLAEAWPKLEHLRLNGMTFPRSIPTSAVYHLYRCCADLRQVSLPSVSCRIIGVDSIPAVVKQPTSQATTLVCPEIRSHM